MVDSGSRASRWLTVGFCAALAVATIAVFAGVLTSDFIRLDDPRYVTQNEIVLDGLTREGSVWAFTTFFKSNWHPITWLSHMLDAELFGPDPGGHHATSLLIHIANSILLFFVLRSATGAAVQSGVVATLFALHPTHVESVAWVAERKDVLSTLFGLLATASFIAYTRRGGTIRYALTALLLLVGLASKASLVTLPFVFLLLDYWPLRRLRFDRRVIPVLVEKLPWVAIVIGFSALTLQAQSAGGAIATGAGAMLPERIANAVMSYGIYVSKTIWPTNLSVLYPHPYLAGGTPWPAWQVAATGLALLAMTAISVCAVRRRYLAVGWLWFVGTLIPMIGLIQVGAQARADRYTYVSCIGLYMIAAWGGADLLRGAIARNRLIAGYALGAALGAIVVLGSIARTQVGYWRDTVTLFEHSLRVAPGAAFLHTNLGNELYERGDLTESLRHHRRAVELMPEVALHRHNLSRGLRESGDMFGATEHSLIGNGVEIDSLEGQSALARVRLQQQDYAGARVHLERAIEIDPSEVNSYVGLALSHQYQGDPDTAREILERGIEAASDPAPAALALARMLVERGDAAAAREKLQMAAASESISAQHLSYLANGLIALGDIDDAIVQLRRAVEANPGDANLFVRLGDALWSRDERDEAIIQYRQAVIVSPDSDEIRSRLDSALAASAMDPSTAMPPPAADQSSGPDSGPR